ncbi:hypothetical protein [Kitasatospora sp. NPDC059571]|uniref:hypothetical protein n=1 Tax=Kitasatospora sp. NPDC059571 TaxID=3346871 RepID=UPI0036C4D9F9
MTARIERRPGPGPALLLAGAELAALALIGLAWAASYLSWDPQSYGDPPGPYLRKAAVAAACAVVAAVVAAVRRVRAVAVGQAVTVALIGLLMAGAYSVGENTYRNSYRDACHAGLGCADADRPPGG